MKKFFENTNVISLIDDNSKIEVMDILIGAVLLFHLHQQLF